MHSSNANLLVESLETCESEGESGYAPAITLQDSRSGSIIHLSEAGSLKALANDQPYRLRITQPLILDVSSTAFDPKDVTVIMSIETTRDNILKAHATGDMRSVLTFYGHWGTEAAVARFVVLTEAAPCLGLVQQHWERVGKLDLWFHKTTGRDWGGTMEAMQNMPLKQWSDMVIVA